jgi:hypothetical protein
MLADHPGARSEAIGFSGARAIKIEYVDGADNQPFWHIYFSHGVRLYVLSASMPPGSGPAVLPSEILEILRGIEFL